MGFTHHGYHKVEQEENFFIITYGGSWNVEQVESFSYELQEILKTSGFKKFGVVSDLREWDGSTPEALLLAKEALDYFFDNGQIVSAHIHNSSVKKQFALGLKQLQASRMPLEEFESMEPAKEWMKRQLTELL